ncbi:amino acid transporter ANT1 [Aegilops tauschii subsp. strangulata]|uniref:Amino acid transporter transmembrane domain-containing protein n=1 Tax=Aegilops tauschii subsp. strangulata TaxID=200361 RepID=A0A453M8Q2_AEGTS|nr:amino acid transporter ANT1 [Aegilops tauschii subsp. strangulata]
MAPEVKVPLLEGRGATPAQTLGNIVVSIVGTGVLGLPYAFRTAGWLAGTLGVAGAGAATFYCMLLLLDCRDKLREQETEEDGLGDEQSRHGDGGNYTYGDLGERCFGPVGRHFTEAIIVLCQTGGTVAYLVFIGQNISSVLPALSPAIVVLALLLPVEVALSFVRSLSALAPFSILADACTVLAVAAVVKEDVQLLVERGQPFADRSAFAGLWGVPFACGVAVFCFEGFCLTLALEASMSNRAKFRPVLLQAIAGVTVVYVGFGVCGYLAYGDATRDIVTLNLPSNWSTAAVKVVLCVALALTFAVMMHPIHEIVESRLLAPGGWVRRRGGFVERAALHLSRVAVVATLAAIACFVPAFGEFAAFVGSTVCALLSFVLPALFHLRVVGPTASTWARAVDYFFLLSGLVFAGHGMYTVLSPQ